MYGAYGRKAPALLLGWMSTQLKLNRLPKKYRDVLFLVDIEERPYKESLEILEIPCATLKSRLFNARQILKEKLMAKSKAITNI